MNGSAGGCVSRSCCPRRAPLRPPPRPRAGSTLISNPFREWQIGTKILVWVALLALCGPGQVPAAAPPYAIDDDVDDIKWETPPAFKEPFKGAIVRGTLLAHNREHEFVFTRPVRLEGAANLERVFAPRPYPGGWPSAVTMTACVAEAPLRWHVSRTSLYTANQGSTTGEHLRRYKLEDILTGGFPTDLQSDAPKGISYGFTVTSPSKDVRKCAEHSTFDASMFYDYLADKDDGATVLAHERSWRGRAER